MVSNRNQLVISPDKEKDFFFRFAMDSSTEFLFGLSANTHYLAHVRANPQTKLASQQSEFAEVSMEGFEDAFKRVQQHVGVRMKVGKSYWMVDGPSYRVSRQMLISNSSAHCF